MTKFMLLVKYDETPGEPAPMTSWDQADITAHLDYYRKLNDELRASGELVGGEVLAGPAQARRVVSDGRGAPVVTDGPFAEAKELLAGYQIVDVDSEQRALEIAARVSEVPGPGGVPLGQSIEVRQVMTEMGDDVSWIDEPRGS